MTTNTAPYQTQPSAACWSRAMPIKIGLAMTADDCPLLGLFRCEVTINDEGNGPFLLVEFFNHTIGCKESPHCGFFFTHADIDQFAAQLHAALKAAEEASR